MRSDRAACAISQRSFLVNSADLGVYASNNTYRKLSITTDLNQKGEASCIARALRASEGISPFSLIIHFFTNLLLKEKLSSTSCTSIGYKHTAEAQ